MFRGFLGGENQAEHVEVEVRVKVILGDVFEGRELVNARIVHQDVELAIGLLGLCKEALDVSSLGDVSLNGNGFAAVGDDFSNDLVRAGFAGCVIDHDGGSLGRETLGDAGSNTLGGSSDDGDFILKFAHDVLSLSGCHWFDISIHV